jgi:hypothetical protein
VRTVRVTEKLLELSRLGSASTGEERPKLKPSTGSYTVAAVAPLEETKEHGLVFAIFPGSRQYGIGLYGTRDYLIWNTVQ